MGVSVSLVVMDLCLDIFVFWVNRILSLDEDYEISAFGFVFMVNAICAVGCSRLRMNWCEPFCFFLW